MRRGKNIHFNRAEPRACESATQEFPDENIFNNDNNAGIDFCDHG